MQKKKNHPTFSQHHPPTSPHLINSFYLTIKFTIFLVMCSAVNISFCISLLSNIIVMQLRINACGVKIWEIYFLDPFFIYIPEVMIKPLICIKKNASHVHCTHHNICIRMREFVGKQTFKFIQTLVSIFEGLADDSHDHRLLKLTNLIDYSFWLNLRTLMPCFSSLRPHKSPKHYPHKWQMNFTVTTNVFKKGVQFYLSLHDYV